MSRYGTIFASIVLLLTATVGWGTEQITNSKHDLSATSPHAVRALDEQRICVFCHTPHGGAPQTPLWNRHSPTTHYRIYRSSTTDARIDQPTGPSKMCLSCHDGSLAIGLVRSRPATDPIPMTVYTLPPGPSNLSNDLSDDHPIGFRFDRALSNADHQLRDPQQISRKLKLGPHSEVQCTTCHNPHNNEYGDFLRVPVRRGVLCTSCHKMYGWRLSRHALSPRSIRSRLIDPTDRPMFPSMADNACLACHRIHGAAGRERLLAFSRSEDNCVTCHDGSVAADILSLVRLPNAHRGSRTITRHDPAENPRTMADHVECVDCHNAHAVREGHARTLRPAAAAMIAGPLVGASGVNVLGRNVRHVRYQYEVCLRCHADNPVRVDERIERVRETRNLRREIGPGAASSHPFVFPARATETPSLIPGLAGRRIDCSDCHNSNNARSLGGSGPDGPHGSVFEFLLGLRYETADFTTETPQAYALCYRCHQRSSILADESFSLHARHIVRVQGTCSTCHDPHGTTGSRTTASRLINFNRAIVSRSPTAGRLEFRDRGRFQGSCTLLCHGVNHVNFLYSP